MTRCSFYAARCRESGHYLVIHRRRRLPIASWSPELRHAWVTTSAWWARQVADHHRSIRPHVDAVIVRELPDRGLTHG